MTSPATPGRNADRPTQLPFAAWKQVLGRAYKETNADNIGLISAGVAFYAFLALVPMLGALVLSYGLFADAATVTEDLRGIAGTVPPEAARLIEDQLTNVVATSDGKKGFALLLALALALYGATKGAGAIVTALNIAYEETETRGFIRLNLLTLAMTAAAVVVALLAVVAIGALGHLDTVFPFLGDVAIVLGTAATYLVLAGVAAGGAASLYRYGPDRRAARWAWLTPGSIFATLGWLAITLGFGFYVSNFGSYGATYGALGGVVVLLTWLYLSSYVLLFGAEINAELEHQTKRDTTVGGEKPLGARRAVMADSVAGEGDASPDRCPIAYAPAPPLPPTLPLVAAVAGVTLAGRKATMPAALGLLAIGALAAWVEGRK